MCYDGPYLDTVRLANKSYKYNCIVYIKMCNTKGINCVEFNSYSTAVRDLLIYTPKAQGCSPWAVGMYYQQIPSSRGISDIYHLGHTYPIGETTNANSPHLFYTVASEDQSWF